MENKFFPEIKGRFAFGCLRLPCIKKEVDIAQLKDMVDYFLDSGFNYFDTAHGYLEGKSELALAEVLVKRYKREEYLIANKLTDSYFNKEEDIIPFFEKQLECCGNLDYFDFYLMHDQELRNYDKFQKCHAYEIAHELKKQGRIKHFGFSFHDSPELLEKILNDHPEVEFVQLQFNYLDYESKNVQSKKLYEVCERYNKPVFVMEPVKGGRLAALPNNVQKIFDELGDNALSYASYAVRFCLDFPNNVLILSGVSDIEQMKDNCKSMNHFNPLSREEHLAINNAVKEFLKLKMIHCGECSYCITLNKCPKGIKIPAAFSCYNDKKMFKGWKKSYKNFLLSDSGSIDSCIKCGSCSDVCPQHLDIPSLLEKVSKEFE